MTSIEARSKQAFLRNEFDAFGKWNMPIIHKTEHDLVATKTYSINEDKQIRFSLSQIKEVN